MSTPDYLSKQDAAAICGVKPTTIQKYKRDGRISDFRYGANNTLEVAVADLVACGLLDPLAVADDLPDHAARSRAETALDEARTELTVAAERIASLEARLADSRDEIVWLRTLVDRGEVA